MRAEQQIEEAFTKYDEAVRANDTLGAVKAVLALRELATINALACWRAFIVGAGWARAQLDLPAQPDAAMQEAADERYPFEDSVRVKDLEHRLEVARRMRNENLIAFARAAGERTDAQVETELLRTIVEEAIGGLVTIAKVDNTWSVIHEHKTESLLDVLQRLMWGEEGNDVGRTDRSEDGGGSGTGGQGGEHVSGGDEAGGDGDAGHVEAVDAEGTPRDANPIRGRTADAENAHEAAGESAEAAEVREAAPGDARDGAEEAAGGRARGEGGEARSDGEPGKWGGFVGGELIAPPGAFGFK